MLEFQDILGTKKLCLSTCPFQGKRELRFWSCKDFQIYCPNNSLDWQRETWAVREIHHVYLRKEKKIKWSVVSFFGNKRFGVAPNTQDKITYFHFSARRHLVIAIKVKITSQK